MQEEVELFDFDDSFGVEESFDFETQDFDFEGTDEFWHKEWYEKPSMRKPLAVNFRRAEELADHIGNLKNEGDRTYSIVDGSFIVGDLLEACMVRRQWITEELTIITLSLSQENIDSMFNLVKGGFVQNLNIIVSAYFFSHERNGFLKYTYKLFEDAGLLDRIQISATRTHCKIAMFKTRCGKHIVIHGSANLRSSGNIEQLMCENNESLYYFNHEIAELIQQECKTINHGLLNSGARLWQAVQQVQGKVEE